MFEKAAEIMKEKNGETCPELSSQYSNLAMANVQLNDQLQAISWLEKALHVFVSLLFCSFSSLVHLTHMFVFDLTETRRLMG